jgi:hypothetical protein
MYKADLFISDILHKIFAWTKRDGKDANIVKRLLARHQPGRASFGTKPDRILS